MADRPETTVEDEPQVQPQATQARESLSLEGNTPAPKVQDAGDATTKTQASGPTETLAKTDQPVAISESAQKHLPGLEVYGDKSDSSRPKATDDASFLQSALAERDPQKRDGQLRLLYRTLNSEQIDKAQGEFTKKTGANSIDEAFSKAGVSENTLKAIDTYRTAAKENRPPTAEERTDLARLGAKSGDRDLLIESVAGNSPEARATRDGLKGDRAFNAGLLRNFKERIPSSNLTEEHLADPTNRVDPILRDYLQEGRVKLSSVTEANTGYFIGNKENTDLAVKNASPEERKEFRQGYELAQKRLANPDSKDPLSPEQERSLKFYDQLQSKFDQAGNRGDALRWQDTLLNGRETVVGQLGRTEKDGTLWGSSHTSGDALKAAGKLSEQDWRTLRNAEHGTTEAERTQGHAFKRQFEQAVDKFAQSPEEASQIKTLIGDKTAKESFSEAEKVGRPLDVSLKDAQTGSHRQQLSESLRALTEISPEQARQYRDDPAVREQVKAQLAKGPAEAIPLSERLLKQVETTGQPPKLEGLEKIEHSQLSGKALGVKDVQELLANPELAKRLGRPEAQQTQEERQANRTLDTAIFNGLSSRRQNEKPPLLGEPLPGDARSQLKEAGDIRRQLTENGGKLSLEQQYRLNQPINDIYQNLANAPTKEQQEFIGKLATSPDRQALASNVAKQGEVRLEDLARSYSIEGKDAKGLSTILDKATPEQITKAQSDWSWKYPGELKDKVLEKANAAESPALRAALNPTGDGRQQLYDNYQQYLNNRGGLTLDGTGLTLERASQLHQEAQKSYEQSRKALPPEQQKQLDEFFGQSLQQNKDSKEKQTQILLDGAITAATLGAGAPTTLAKVAGRIAAGGITEAAGTSLARGEFKPEKFIADFAQGGASAYAGRAAQKAGEHIATKLERTTGTGTGASIKQAEAEATTSGALKTKSATEEVTATRTEVADKTTTPEVPAHTTKIEKPVEGGAKELARATEGKIEGAALKPSLPLKSDGASPTFTDKVAASMEALPPDVAQKLKDQGVSVQVVGNIHDFTTDKAYLSLPMRGQPGKTQSDSVGFFSPQEKKIVLVEKSLTGSENWPGNTVQRAVAHELGHPVDSHMVGDVLKKPEFARSAEAGRPLIGRQISDLPEFQKAVFADMQQLSKKLAEAAPEDRQAIASSVDYNLANNGYHLKKLGIDGIGTHFDNPAQHQANGIREAGGRHSDARSEVFADIHSDLLIGEDRYTKHFPQTTALIRDKVLQLPTVPLNEVTTKDLQSLGFKEIGRAGERVFYQGADRSSVIYNEGRLSGLSDGKNHYNLGYNDQGQLAKLESESHKFEMINGAWQKSHAGGVEKLPHAPVISRLGNGQLRIFDQ